ncbi:MAG TPA: hypothetical protein VEL82_01650 [Thermoplasmata archaeon]|nr:hypothetical protein [Thermoplasmata archaeon]
MVHGTSRPVVNLVLYALAERANPRFQWLEIRPEEEARDRFDPVHLGWLEERRVWRVDPSHGLSPDNPRANAAIFHLVREDEPPTLLARLADFLRLPPTIQEIIGSTPSSGEPILLAVADVDRISGAIADAALAPILAAFAWMRCSVFVGYSGGHAPSRTPFTHVLRVEGPSAERWAQARIHVEKGTVDEWPTAAAGLLLSDLPFLRETFRRAIR